MKTTFFSAVLLVVFASSLYSQSGSITNTLGSGGSFKVKGATSDSLLVVKDNGNVGIGTASPTSRLTVLGSGAPGSINANTLLHLKNSEYAAISIEGGSTGASFIDFNDQAGIAPGQIQYEHPSNSFRFHTNGSEKLRITSDGNLGIGTTTPGAKLEVAGNVKIADGSQAVGKVLTSDANGLATWATAGTVHTIGESYGGGKVFYVYDGGQHGLIAATADQSTGISWYGGTYTNTRARADGVGAGLKNTAIIIANQGPVDVTGAAFAATVCNEYSVTVGGVTYGDWYLPSKHELDLLYLQKTAVGGFGSSAYWSSTEFDPDGAWLQHFDGGPQINFSKGNSYYVRAIRAF